MKKKGNQLTQLSVAPIANATDQELEQLVNKLSTATIFPWKIEKAKQLFAKVIVLPI
ncbi:MAG: hypothetical protein ACRYFZ_02405 [Janthinobacterium lividum]